MRLGIISDVHGNLVALEAVLADLEARRPDTLVCLGDVVALGPQPRQAVERVRALGCPVVMCNTDEWLLAPPPAEPAADDRARRIADLAAWGAGELSPADLDFLRGFQPTVELSLGAELTVLCYHGSPLANTDRIVPTTPDEELDRLLAGSEAAVLVGGHTHEAMLRRHRGRVVLNPGSVSLPVHHLPVPPSGRSRWAEYAVLDWDGARLSVEQRAVPLDLGAIERAARESGMPHADWWLDGWG